MFWPRRKKAKPPPEIVAPIDPYRDNIRPPEVVDWRLHGQEKYLRGLELTFFEPPKIDDGMAAPIVGACELCSRRFFAEVLAGYSTADERHRVCVSCFVEFRDAFAWKIGR